MKISILISTYNGENDIRSLLNSIKKLESNSCKLEIILRDDGSLDKTVEIIEDEYKWVNLIQDDYGNLGFVKSNNIAYQKATGDIICCVNQDTILHSRFVIEGVRHLQNNTKIGGINSNMIMPWVMSYNEFENCSYESLPAYEYQLTNFGYVRYVEAEKISHESNFMTGGGFFVRRDSLSDAYLFDPYIDMYCEDTELSLRLRRAGWKIMYCPKTVIYHNQIIKRATPFREVIKLIRITRNRFALFARIESPISYSRNYLKYIMGIVGKMKYLGFPLPKKIGAYVAGIGIAFLFLLFFPYWLIYSRKYEKKHISSRS